MRPVSLQTAPPQPLATHDLRTTPRSSEPAPPEVERVVEDGALVPGQPLVRSIGGQLDPHDLLQHLPRRPQPPDVEPLALPPLPGPEPFHRNGVVARAGPPEPVAERRPRGVVVDDEGR